MPEKDSLFESLKDLLFDNIDPQLQPSNSESSGDTAQEFGVSDKLIIAAPTNQANRVFSQEECCKLDTQTRDYILYSVQLGLISPLEREHIIDTLLVSDSATVAVDELKWVLLETLDNELSFNDLNFLDFILFPHDAPAH